MINNKLNKSEIGGKKNNKLPLCQMKCLLQSKVKKKKRKKKKIIKVNNIKKLVAFKNRIKSNKKLNIKKKKIEQRFLSATVLNPPQP